MEKKETYRKMKKSGAILGLCVGAAVLLSGCAEVEPVIAEIKTKIGLTPETETELAAGQRKAEITVVSIVGNELTYREKETEAPETESELETGELSKAGEVSETEENPETSVIEAESAAVEQMNFGGSFPGGGEMPGGSFPGGGEMPGGSFPGGGEMPGGSFPGRGSSETTQIFTSGETETSQMPDMSGMDMSQMPDMSGMPDMSQMPDMSGMDMSQMPDMSGMDMSQMPGMSEMFAEMAGETVYLSVGVVVHADNGKDTTFAILEEGDVLQALFETRADGTEVITELWMEGRY